MENFKDKKADDILEKLVHINRITKVVKGGRRFGFSALVFSLELFLQVLLQQS